jgi:hypothetical protein
LHIQCQCPIAPRSAACAFHFAGGRRGDAFSWRQMNGAKGIPMKGLVLLGLLWLASGCSEAHFRKPALQITLSDIQVDEEAVEQAMARIAVSPAPSGDEVPETLKALFSFLVQTPSDKLVETRPHAGTRWHLDQIYLLDDCVAAQFSEGHYMETVFFVRNRRGWRIAGRIRPGDHR